MALDLVKRRAHRDREVQRTRQREESVLVEAEHKTVFFQNRIGASGGFVLFFETFHEPNHHLALRQIGLDSRFARLRPMYLFPSLLMCLFVIPWRLSLGLFVNHVTLVCLFPDLRDVPTLFAAPPDLRRPGPHLLAAPPRRLTRR